MDDLTVLEKMMTTVISGQAELRKDMREGREAQKGMSSEIKAINQQLVNIVRIEEKQLSQKEAFTRLGKHVDTLDARVAEQEIKMTDIRIVTARLVVKVTLIAGGSSALVTGVLLMVIKSLAK